MIVLRDQAYYVPGLPKDLRIISPHGIFTQEWYEVTFIAHCHDEHDTYAKINLKEEQTDWQNPKPAERVYIEYDNKNNLPTHEDICPNHRDKKVKALESSIIVTNKDNQKLTTSKK